MISEGGFELSRNVFKYQENDDNEAKPLRHLLSGIENRVGTSPEK